MEKLPMCRICLAKDVLMYVVANKDLHKFYEKLTGNQFITEDHRPILACFFCCTKLKQCCRFQKQCLEAEELFSLMLNEDYEPEKDSGNSCSDLEYKLALTFESDSEDDVVSKKKRRAGTKRAPVAKKSKLQIQRIKAEDVEINEEQKTYEQSESRVTRAKVKNSSSVKNTTLDTSISNISDNDDNKCKKSKKFIDTDDANEHQRHIDKRKRFKCGICQRGFSQRSHLNTHLRIHSGDKRYECGICLSAFTRIDLLYKHMHRHTGEKPFKCDICKRRFTQKANLKRHTLIHTGEKPYKCHLCQHSCNQKADLKKHIRIHTDEKPYKCDLCQHGCNQKGDLIIHFLRKHHTCNKPFK